MAEAEKTAEKVPDIGSVLFQYLGSQSQVAADVRRLLGVFNPQYVNTKTRCLMRLDPVIAFGLAILRAPIVGLRWTVESKDPEIKAFVEAALGKIYHRLAVGGSMAIGFGNQVLEKVWESKPLTVEVADPQTGERRVRRYPNAWRIKRTKAIDPRTVTILRDLEADDWSGVEQSIEGRKEKAKAGRSQVILWVFRQEEVWGALHGLPMLDQVYEPWWWKVAGSLFCNRYFERKADPPTKARCQEQVITSSGKKCGFQFMADTILAARQGAPLLLPGKLDEKGNPLWDVEFLLDDKRGDMFQLRLNALDTQILRGLWITDKAATSDGTGSLAMSTQHGEVLSTMQEAIQVEWIDDVLNPQVVEPTVLYNFGAQRLEESQTQVKASGLTAAQRDLNRDLIKSLLQAEQAVLAGKEVRLSDLLDAKAMAEQIDLPIRSQKEVEKIVAARAERAPDIGGGAGDQAEEDEDLEIDEETEREAMKDLERVGAVPRRGEEED